MDTGYQGGNQGVMAGGLSPDGYLDRRLRPLDAEHYSAAGLLPYRRKDGAVELLLPKEKPWNSFTQDYDPLSWNLFGGKRIPRKERSVETTAVRSFLETVGQVDGAPDQEKLYSLMLKSFMAWYPTGKFALIIVEVPEGELDDFPMRYTAMKEQAGPEQEYRILPQGIKKWNKIIPEISWVAAETVLSESAKSEVSDLLGSMLQITAVREFCEGAADPDKDLPPAPPSRPEAGGGAETSKGSGGKGRGGAWKGGGAGKMSGKGNMFGMPKGCGAMMMMAGKGPMAQPMMFASAKGMPMMSPMLYPPFQPQIQQQPVEMQRQMYGEQLYVLVQPLAPSPYLAQKITGMLLELPHKELILNLTNTEELQRRVKEALDVLREDGVA